MDNQNQMPVTEVNNSLPPENLPPQKPGFFSKISKKALVISLSALTGVLVLAGAAWSYMYYYQNPGKVIKASLEKMKEIKTMKFDSSINVEGEIKTPAPVGGLFGPGLGESDPAEPKKINTQIKLSGAVDASDPDNQKISLNFGASGINFIPGITASLGFQGLTINDVTYIKLDQIPVPGVDLSFITNQWIKVDEAEIREKLGLNELFSKLQAERDKVQEADKQELTLEQKNKLTELFTSSKIFRITDKLPSEKINGQGTYHYAYLIDTEKIPAVTKQAYEIIMGEKMPDEESKKAEEAFGKAKPITGEIFIGKNDKYLHRLTGNADFSEEVNKNSARLNFTFDLSDHNKPIDIQAPASSKPVGEVLQELFGGLFSGMPSSTPGSSFEDSTAIDSDDDGLSDANEKVFGTNPKNPDTDGDGYKDGSEVLNGYNPKGPGKMQ